MARIVWVALWDIVFVVTLTACGSGGGGSKAPPTAGSPVDGPSGGVTAAAQAPGVCEAASPDDELADDDALQDCFIRGKLVQLRSGEPGYLIARGLEILGQQGVTLRGQPGAPARLVADRALGNYLLKAFGVSDFSLEHLVIDGIREQRTFRCNTHGMRPSNLFIIGDGVRIEHVQSTGSLCGTGMGVAGSGLVIRRNWVHDNGFTDADRSHGTDQWSDGITVTDCTDGVISDNLVEDNTDVGIIIAGSERCYVADNRIHQQSRKAFAGLGVHNFGGDGRQGDHRGSIFTRNVIDAAPDMLDYGISLGIHTWNPGLHTRNAHVTGNTVSGAIIGLSVDGLSDSYVMDNTVASVSPGRLSVTPPCTASAPMAFAHMSNVCLQEMESIGLITDQDLHSCRHTGDACDVLEQLPEDCPSRPRWQKRCRAGRGHEN